MDRPFTPDDNDRRFKVVGTDDADWGLLEYPLADPGTLSPEEAARCGALWFTHNDRLDDRLIQSRGPRWLYVAPEDVERVLPPWDR